MSDLLTELSGIRVHMAFLRKDETRVLEAVAQENKDLKAKLEAVRPLPERWRRNANTADDFVMLVIEKFASELEAILEGEK